MRRSAWLVFERAFRNIAAPPPSRLGSMNAVGASQPHQPARGSLGRPLHWLKRVKPGHSAAACRDTLAVREDCPGDVKYIIAGDD